MKPKADQNNFYVGSYEETDQNKQFNLVVWVQFDEKIELEKLDLLIS